MLRLKSITLSLIILSACAPAGPNNSSPAGGPTALPAPATLPMDPGRVTCAQVNADAGFAVAGAPWVMGQIQAANLSTGGPALTIGNSDVATAIVAYCGELTSATLRDAARAIAAG